MVRFRMAHYEVINLVHINNFLQFLKILIEEFRLRRLKKHRLTAGFHHIGVISRSKLRIHDDVKYPKLIVDDSCPIKVVSQFNTFHVCLLLSYFK